MAKRWYVVHVYSGFEKKIAQAIKEDAARKGLADHFDEVLVPAEDVVEIRRGQKVAAERKFFPGYVLVKMELTDEAWHLVRDTPKVTGFLGSKTRPTPISEAEADRILKQAQEGVERPARPSVLFEVGEQGARGRRSVHVVQRDGGRGRRGEGPAQGVGVDLRAVDAGGPRIQPGRKGLEGQGFCPWTPLRAAALRTHL